ncbi:sigma-70 family RNA polymerase sigma factor [Pseudoxanthomonas sp. PXM02]|uniref:sigma-70 family RNA polymerase sigma factor n=1 Tax=Pseudoxanthomonas sp. PXM02 TaxID=2769294 RepID=UPI00177F34CE|nr:sigma-70 family RNA polymerase sigma factor [Pseudoxanthomonas sp. PXM02]MBD9477410.1 sigma-70 family RNA polymerase sigma factor [Pseudoxanthomonas sp. PXM02]
MAIEDAEQELWRRYHEDEDAAARDYLFLKYAPWARRVAGGVMGRVPLRGMEWADHVQNAQIGLLEAMSRFDVRRGIEFTAFAKPRVRGAIFNGIRAFMRSPADRSMDTVASDRAQSLWETDDQDPLDGFIDAVVGLSLGYFLENGSDAGDVDSLRIDRLLGDVLLDLPSRQRQIVIAHYFHHRQFQQIAEDMHVTKGRVSQLHKSALAALRDALRQRNAVRDSFF